VKGIHQIIKKITLYKYSFKIYGGVLVVIKKYFKMQDLTESKKIYILEVF